MLLPSRPPRARAADPASRRGSHRGTHRAHRPGAPARALVGALVAGLAALVLIVAPSAGATTATANIDTASQSATGVLTVSGWAADRRHPSQSITVTVSVDGRWVRTVRARSSRPAVNRAHHLSGGHGFRLTIALPHTAHRVVIRTHDGARAVLAVRTVRHVSDPGARIVALARRYVGARYVDGGASPRGFDCSGYTQYVLAHAHVSSLPHNAEAQRRVARAIPRSQARPGDLVFYLSGGWAYHVAIYAGGGRQYSAATPRDGVRFQPIWSSAVRFGTTWH